MRRAFVLLAVACVGCRTSPSGTPAPSGAACYEADRPLGLDFGATGEAPSPALARFEVWPGGEVRRAGLRPARNAAGKGDPVGWSGEWRRGGDTLHVRMGTCCSGWTLALTPEPGGARPGTYVGVATYGSDVIAVDRPAPVRVREAPCPAPGV